MRGKVLRPLDPARFKLKESKIWHEEHYQTKNKECKKKIQKYHVYFIIDTKAKYANGKHKVLKKYLFIEERKKHSN